MLIKASQVIGLKVITLDTAEDLGKVQDVIFDPLQNRVVAFLLDEGGWFKDAKVIQWKDARSVGEDALMVASENVIMKAGDVSQHLSATAKNDNYLTQTKIVTEDGKELGHVSDILFDSATGQVREFEVSRGALQGMVSKKQVSVQDIITVGKDATIVQGYTEAILEQQEATEGLQATARDLAEKGVSVAQSTAQTTMQKGQEVVSRAQEKAQAVAYDSRTQERMKEAKITATRIAQDARNKASEAQSAAQQKVEEVQQDPRTQQTVEETKGILQDVKQIVTGTLRNAREDLHQEAQKPQYQPPAGK